MSDIDDMRKMLDVAKIVYHEDWNRAILIGGDTSIVRWLTVYNERGKPIDIQFSFTGNLTSIGVEI